MKTRQTGHTTFHSAQYVLCSASKVFSYDSLTNDHKGKSYTLTIGSYTFDEDTIADIRFSESAPNHGMYGISTGQLTCNIYSEISKNILENLEPNSSVSFSEINAPLVLTSASAVSKNVLSITAAKLTINASIPFYKEDSYPPKDSDGKSILYSLDNVVRDACSLAGTPWFASGNLTNVKVYVSEFEGKSCSSIIEETSKIYGGTLAVSSSGGGMQFYGSDTSNYDTISDPGNDSRSDLHRNKTRQISRVLVTDSESSEVYNFGSVLAPWYETETLDGDYLFGESVCKRAAYAILGSYHSWNCENIVLSQTPSFGQALSIGDDKLPIQSINCKYTKNHVVASLGAPEWTLSYADYKNGAERMLESKVNAGTVYGGTSIDSKDGLCFVWTDSSSESTVMRFDEGPAERLGERYAFTPGKGGLVEFDGAVTEKVVPKAATKDGDSVTLDYDSGQKIKFTAAKDSSGNITSFTREVLEQ